MTKIRFEHYGDNTVGIRGDSAILDIDLSYFDAEERDWTIEDIRESLERTWDFPTHVTILEEK